MKPHRCTRFKQTGSLRFLSGEITITRNGKRETAESMSADSVQLKCVHCGTTRWVERQSVEEKGNVLTLKAGVDLEER